MKVKSVVCHSCYTFILRSSSGCSFTILFLSIKFYRSRINIIVLLSRKFTATARFLKKVFEDPESFI